VHTLAGYVFSQRLLRADVKKRFKKWIRTQIVSVFTYDERFWAIVFPFCASDIKVEIVCWRFQSIYPDTNMTFVLEHFYYVKTSIILCVAISLCNANMQSAMTMFTWKKVWQQATHHCRKSQKSRAWKSVTRKDRKAGALWQDITRPQNMLHKSQWPAGRLGHHRWDGWCFLLPTSTHWYV